MLSQVLVWSLVGLGVLFGFLNGVQASGSLTAAWIASGAVGPRRALLLTAGAQFVGAMTVGLAVANAIGKGIVNPAVVTIGVVIAALAGANLWNLLTWYLGLPSSASHALIGALVGATWYRAGWQSVSLSGLGMVLLALFLSPWIGFVASYGVMRLTMFLLRNATPRVGVYLRQVQWLLAPLLAVGQGANDSQKSMGIVALGLVALRELPSFSVPPWLQLVAALSLAIGTSVGGVRIMRTLGLRLYRIRAIHGFASTGAAAVVVLLASVLGGPVSTTQVIGTSIAGAGSAQRFSQVRWQVLGNIVLAWFLTIPAAALLGAGICWALERLAGVL